MHIHIQNRPYDHFVPITAAELLQSFGASAHRFTIGDDDASFTAALPSMNVLVTTADQLLQRFPAPAPHLRAVFLKHAGVEILLGHQLLPPGVVLLNNSGAHGRKAGEYALMATLMLRTGMPRFARQQGERQWQPHFTGVLAGTRVTILGVGGLGSGAAAAMRPLGVRLTGVRHSGGPHPLFDEIATFDQFDAVLPRTDVLILAAPLTAATRRIVGAPQLRLLPPGAGLINMARGELIDEPALIEALESGRLSGAVLDVTTTEPLPASDPLWTAPNLVLTPHVSATDTRTYAADTLRILFDNLDDLEQGRRPRNLVDLERGY